MKSATLSNVMCVLAGLAATSALPAERGAGMVEATPKYRQSAPAATESIEQRVSKIVAEQLGVDLAVVKMSSRFVADLQADSLDVIELIMALEEEFATEIPDEEAEKITTVEQAVAYLARKVETGTLQRR